MDLTLDQKINRDIEDVIIHLEHIKKIRDYDEKLEQIYKTNQKVNGVYFRWQEKLERVLLR